MADTPPPPSSNQKWYGVINIKTYVPIILDLNELNYDAWRELFETHCRGFGVRSFLTGESKPTSADDEEWYKLDSVVKTWLYGTLTQSLLNMILKKDSTAFSVWKSLEELFRDNKDARAIELDNELRSMTLGDLSIAQYCQKMKSISDLLANIDNPVPEKTLVAHLLNGLSPQYEHIATLLRHRDPLPTFLQARSKLLVEEHRFKTNRNHPAAHTDHASSPTVLVADNKAPSSTGASCGGRRPNNSRRGGNHSDQRRQQSPAASAVPGFSPPQLPWPPYPLPWQPLPWPYTPLWSHPRSTTPLPQQQRRPPAADQQPGILGPPPPSPAPPAHALHASVTPTLQALWQ
ncbi:hypothetical protein L1887_31775 [Cichorium endivia]|nr:hypothetical protein L1887_31775 [Cichorium endivia]